MKSIIFIFLLGALFLSACNGKYIYKRDTIYFDHESAEFNGEQLKRLDSMSVVWNSDSDYHLKIIAFTDTLGDTDQNLKLSKQRAIITYNYIMSHTKIKAQNSLVRWLGETDNVYDQMYPVVHNHPNCVVVIIGLPERMSKDSSKLFPVSGNEFK